MRFFTSKKRVAAAALAGAVVLGGGLGAYAFWTSSGSGTGSASTGTDTHYAVTVDSDTSAALTPGGPTETLGIDVHNTSPGVQKFTSVLVSVADSNGDPWSITGPNGGCSYADFSLNGAVAGMAVQAHGTTTQTLLADGHSTGLTVDIQLINSSSNQDDCKSVNPPVHAVVS